MTDSYPTIIWRWSKEHGAMKPHGPYARMAEKLFEDGESYRLEPREERSDRSNRHMHAEIRNAWEQLPESIAHRFPQPEALRAQALCMTGWCDENAYTLQSKEAAIEFGKMMRKHLRYAVISIFDNVVIVRVAKSQSARNMNKDDFQKSKTDVLNWISDLIGVTRAELEKATKNHG